MVNSTKSCKNRWLHVLNFPLSYLLIKFQIIFAVFSLRKAKVFAKAKTKTFRFNSRLVCIRYDPAMVNRVKHKKLVFNPRQFNATAVQG
jgi:hypothetical protein